MKPVFLLVTCSLWLIDLKDVSWLQKYNPSTRSAALRVILIDSASSNSLGRSNAFSSVLTRDGEIPAVRVS